MRGEQSRHKFSDGKGGSTLRTHEPLHKEGQTTDLEQSQGGLKVKEAVEGGSVRGAISVGRICGEASLLEM
ncbi:hypothetical protein Tco_1092822 [Tanacetum coccineum]|uniref:Uncharacterized protein n=1 Tax=Tanacetum coccineum TaxID=301880 RepID=A0ABQ5IC77_9ASTR